MILVDQLQNPKWQPITLTAEDGITVILSDMKEDLTELAGYLAGYRMPVQGTVLVNGKEANGTNVGYMPAGAPIYENMSLVQWLAFMGSLKGLGKAEAEQQAAELLEKYAAPEIGELYLEKKTQTKDRVLAVMLQTLTGNPGVIVLDQPTAGLDDADAEVVYDLAKKIAEEHAVILMVTDPNIAEMLEGQLLLFHEGIIKQVTVEELHVEHTELYQEMVKEQLREEDDLSQILEDYEGGSRDDEPNDTK